VDGHKAASDVRDEFVSVTEKLMDELAQCYNVLPQLDINNTIDHRPEGDEKWFLENEKTVTQFCRKLAAERPLKTRYGFRCCHLKNIWTAPLPPETELSRQMTTSTTSIDIMGLQAAYANLHTDQERDYFMQRYHDVISSFGGK